MKNRNEELKRKLKKAASISLCAVLAGGLAAGTYTGVNYLTGYEQSVQAASEDKVELLKSEKKSDDSKDDSKDESTAKGSLDVSDIVEAAMPSIVSITTKSVEEVQSYYGMFGQYGAYSPSQEQEVQGSGSGIIIGKNDSELLIATNYHVVEGAETLSVGFCDSTACEAKVKGYDSEKDLAVVAVSLDDIDSDTMDAITIATIGNSDDLKVGAQVVAIGNALGYGQSVTTGIVSAKNRQLNSDDTVGDYDSDSNSATNLIQTDAAINPGNSGGALLNMNGEVVGINSAKLASTEVEGIGYAIAISDVTDTLENLMNEAAILTAKDGRYFINQNDIRQAFIKTGIGAEKKSRVISEKEKKITAYHEAGHAILFHVLPEMEPVHTISIIPTGMGAAGYTMPLPGKDEMFNSKNKMLENIVVSLGGRIAEELIFGDITTGASQDIKQASQMARAMVTQYGMSEKVGMIHYGSDEDEVFIGRDLAHTRNYAEETASLIDSEVKRIIDESYAKAKKILQEHEDVLHKCAELLIEKEKIGREEFEALF